MEKLSKEENQILDDIFAGKYKDYHLLYDRRSLDEPDSQKNSLKYQRSENLKYALREKLKIAPITLKGFCLNGVISEKHSGFKEGNEITFTKDGKVQYEIERPKFLRLVEFLSKHFFKGSISLCWDRASRNKSDDALIGKLIRSGVDMRFTFAKYDKSSSGALHMDIDGMFAQHHSRVTSEKVTLATLNLRERGICTYRAPVGYLNPGKKIHHKPFDPERWKVIRELAELVVAKKWSLGDATYWANKQGLTMTPMRRKRTEEEMKAEEEDEIENEKTSRPMTRTGIHRILTNPFYTGKILGNNGEWVQSNSHEAIIPEGLFLRVQEVLKSKRTSMHYENILDLPNRKLIYCSYCGRVFTPYIQKGVVYFGAHCLKTCANPVRNFNLEFLEDEIGKLMAKLYFTDDELVELDARTKTDLALFEEKRHKELEQTERKKKKVREDLAYLRSNKLSLLKTGVYSAEAFMEEENQLNTELLKLQALEHASDEAMHEVVKDIVKLSELLKNAYLYYDFADSREKEEIHRIIFSELRFSGNVLTYKCKNGFQALESRFATFGDATGI